MCLVDDTIARINAIKPIGSGSGTHTHTTTTTAKYPCACHGCGGKGWVTAGGQAQKCPVCGGSGKCQEWDGKYEYISFR